MQQRREPSCRITFRAYVTLLVVFLSQGHGAGIRAATCSEGSGGGSNQLAELNKMGKSPWSCQEEKFNGILRNSFDRHWAKRESLPVSPRVVIAMATWCLLR